MEVPVTAPRGAVKLPARSTRDSWILDMRLLHVILRALTWKPLTSSPCHSTKQINQNPKWSFRPNLLRPSLIPNPSATRRGRGEEGVPRGRTPVLTRVLSQLRADLPQLWEKALVKRRAKVLRATAPAGPCLAADLALHHQDVAGPPVRERLVVVEQGFA
jgi:hypothetical protein